MKDKDCGHLYEDGRHYDLHYAKVVDDIPFFQRQHELYGGPVLELACGTGRITIPMALKGADITGLDLAPRMLEHARAKAAEAGARVEWAEADCRDFRLGRKFRLIMLPFSSFQHFHDIESHEACLARVREHLDDGGVFVLDLFNPKMEFLTRDPDKRYPVVEYDDPDGGGRVVVTENNVYDAASQVNRVKWYYRIGDAEEFVRDLNVRVIYPLEIDALLKYNGFEILHKYGDYEEGEFRPDSPKQVMVCRTAGRYRK